MKVQDLADIFGVPGDLMGGRENYSQLRADMLEQHRRTAAIREIATAARDAFVEHALGLLLERVIAHLVLEVESDQAMRGPIEGYNCEIR